MIGGLEPVLILIDLPDGVPQVMVCSIEGELSFWGNKCKKCWKEWCAPIGKPTNTVWAINSGYMWVTPAQSYGHSLHKIGIKVWLLHRNCSSQTAHTGGLYPPKFIELLFHDIVDLGY
jgi:hypothetical protein